MNNLRCPDCGYDMEGKAFCENCSAAPGSDAPALPEESPAPAAAKRKGLGKRGTIVMLVISAMVLVAVIIMIAIGSCGQSWSNSTEHIDALSSDKWLFESIFLQSNKKPYFLIKCEKHPKTGIQIDDIDYSTITIGTNNQNITAVQTPFYENHGYHSDELRAIYRPSVESLLDLQDVSIFTMYLQFHENKAPKYIIVTLSYRLKGSGVSITEESFIDLSEGPRYYKFKDSRPQTNIQSLNQMLRDWESYSIRLFEL